MPPHTARTQCEHIVGICQWPAKIRPKVGQVWSIAPDASPWYNRIETLKGGLSCHELGLEVLSPMYEHYHQSAVVHQTSVEPLSSSAAVQLPDVFSLSSECSWSVVIQKCSQYPYRGPRSNFPQKVNLPYIKTCRPCQESTAKAQADKNTDMTDDVNSTGTHARCDPDAPARRGPRVQPFKGCASLEWDKTIALLTKHQDKAFEPDAFIQMEGPSAMEAFQDVDSRSGDSQESGLSRVDATGYRFVCFCAQNDKDIIKMRLTDEENKRWLHATVDSVNPSTV
ncbi:hypothetical protein DFH09DRAFT_1081162 [Mycena vulgaris]|nr:hypothetical protein DFH09DRAFT_1081162 [Mycena vulgaris]